MRVLICGGGVIGGAAAAIPGWMDWAAIPSGTRAKRVGLLHGAGNVIVLALFVLSWLLRRPNPSAPPTESIVAGLLGVAVVAVTGWLGGELVGRLGVAVDEGAHLDAPSSLSALPAATQAHSVSRAAMGGYSGRERRAHPQPAYAGLERRMRGAVR